MRPVEPEAGFGRLDPAARAVEELRPEPLLERAHLQADGRLGDAEPLRRLAEAPPLDDGAEGRELTRVHKRILCVGTGDRERGLRSPGGRRLEDTLVTGYTRLAAATPHRRIDLELRLLDLLFAALFALLLLPVVAAIALPSW